MGFQNLLSHAGAGGDPAQVLVASGQVWHLELKRGSQTLGRQTLGSRLQRGASCQRDGETETQREHTHLPVWALGPAPGSTPLLGRKGLEGARGRPRHQTGLCLPTPKGWEHSAMLTGSFV